MSEKLNSPASTRLGISLALCSIPAAMSAVVLVPIVPGMLRTFATVQNADFWIPALISIPAIFTAVLSPVFGYVGDKFGLKSSIIVCLMLFALLGAAPLLLRDFSLIVVTRVGLGIAQAGMVLAIAMIGQQFEGATREKWISLQALAATSCSLWILPLSGFLAQTSLGWHGSFLIFFSGIALALVIARTPARTVNQGRSLDEPMPALPVRWLLTRCCLTLLVAIVFFSVQFQFGLALATVGVSDPRALGLLAAVAVSGTMLGSALFVRAKRLLGRWLLPTELLVSGVTLLLLRQFTDVVPLVGFAFVHLVACGLMLPTLVTMFAEGLPDAVRGRGLGLWNSAFTFGQFLSAGIIGFILTRPGANVFDAFAILGIGALIMAFVGFILSLKARR